MSGARLDSAPVRRWGAWVCAVALAAMLAACGGGGDAPVTAGAPDPALPARAPVGPGAPGSTPPAPAPSPAAPPSDTAPAPLAVAPNVLPIVMDRGTDGSAVNSPFVSVTVCAPGTQACQTIDHVLVDTGSVGLRVAASALRGLALPAAPASGDAVLGECASFASGFTWGAVRTADVRLGGEQATALAIQVMDDPGAPYRAVPTACLSTGPALPDAGSNGILGVGFAPQDCGAACAAGSAPGMYFSCAATGCTGVAVPLARQLAHPVAALEGPDNNGLAIVLPQVAAGGVPQLEGTLLLGIGTRDNNQLAGAVVYTANNAGNFTTAYKGRTTAAFIDSGSNGIFFADRTILRCSSGFYCPGAALSLTATASGTNGASVAVPFTVENAAALGPSTAAAHLGGSVVLGGTFDWGLPFFFGRAVFVGIAGANTPAGAGPFWAF